MSPWTVLAALFLLTPIVEIYVLVQVGQVIGAWPTVALLLVESALGAWLVKREGRRAWDALRLAMGSGRLPGRELTDAALVLVGGTLLLTPGFVTDVFGFICVLPFTRPVARAALRWYLRKRGAGLALSTTGPGRPSAPGGAAWWGGTGHQQQGPVVAGEVVDED